MVKIGINNCVGILKMAFLFRVNSVSQRTKKKTNLAENYKEHRSQRINNCNIDDRIEKKEVGFRSKRQTRRE